MGSKNSVVSKNIILSHCYKTMYPNNDFLFHRCATEYTNSNPESYRLPNL